MCSQEQVGNVDIWWGQHHRPMDFPTWLLIIYRQRVLTVLNIFHDPIWGLIENDNVYLTLLIHEVFCEDRKITTLGTELLHMTF